MNNQWVRFYFPPMFVFFPFSFDFHLSWFLVPLRRSRSASFSFVSLFVCLFVCLFHSFFVLLTSRPVPCICVMFCMLFVCLLAFLLACLLACLQSLVSASSESKNSATHLRHTSAKYCATRDVPLFNLIAGVLMVSLLLCLFLCSLDFI